MNILSFKIVGAVLTIIVGVVSVIKPTSAMNSRAAGYRALRHHWRSVPSLGAVFIGLGLAPFLLGLNPAAFVAGGVTYIP
jgi:hypothetical protein